MQQNYRTQIFFFRVPKINRQMHHQVVKKITGEVVWHDIKWLELDGLVPLFVTRFYSYSTLVPLFERRFYKLFDVEDSDSVWRTGSLTPSGDGHDGIASLDELLLLAEVNTELDSVFNIHHPLFDSSLVVMDGQNSTVQMKLTSHLGLPENNNNDYHFLNTDLKSRLVCILNGLKQVGIANGSDFEGIWNLKAQAFKNLDKWLPFFKKSFEIWTKMSGFRMVLVFKWLGL